MRKRSSSLMNVECYLDSITWLSKKSSKSDTDAELSRSPMLGCDYGKYEAPTTWILSLMPAA